jgi:TetR/AcrR family transcriptional regulator, transcriptional repressor of bet genes
MREERRAELVSAFARVLAAHGFAGATIAAVAAEANVAPGLVHHYFASKEELLECLLRDLTARFRRRTRDLEAREGPLGAYAAAAVRLDATADTVAARCWVGMFAEAVRSPALFAQVRRLVDVEIESIRQRSSYRLSHEGAGAVLAFVIGALVLGAFAPRKTAGFAAPALEKLIAALEERSR